MADLSVADFNKFKAFFQALKDINFNPAKPIPSTVKIDNRPTPVDKTRCFELLRSYPGLESKEDVDIIRRLSLPGNRNNFFSKLTRTQQIELAYQLTDKPETAELGKPIGQEGSAEPAIPENQAPASTGMPMGMPSAPSMPSVSRISRIIHDVPHAEEAVKPEIHIANKSGAVAETLPLQPKLVIANSSGTIKEAPPSKIFIADSKGNIIKEHSIPNKKKFNFSAIRPSASLVNTAKNLCSKASVFFQKNVGKFFTVGRIATVVSGGIGAITGGALTNGNTLGILGGGGVGAIAPSWIRSGEGAKFFRKVGNGAINAGANLSNQIGNSSSKFSPSSKKLAWGLIGALFLFVFVSGLIGGLTGTTPGGEAAPGGTNPTGSDISSCKFTRAGNSQLIKSSVLAGWISNAAASAGIPAQVLASIAMHESQHFTANADNNHDAIKSKQYCNYGPWLCINKENTGTIQDDEGNDRACTDQDIASGAKTARAVGLMQNIDIYNPGKDLCSITESLAIAAVKLKNDGITAQPTQSQVNQAINSYYNSCTYGSYSYCNEVWQDLQNCKPASGSGGLPPSIATDCPIPNGKLTCGSQATPVIGQDGKLCGHCGINYEDRCIVNANGTRTCVCDYPGTKFAIDIKGEDFDNIFLPKVNGNAVTWTFEREEAKSGQAIQEYTGTAIIQDYTGATSGDGEKYYLQLHHTQPGSGNPGTRQSGDVGGKICGGGCNERHTHVQLGNGGNTAGSTGWLDAAEYFCKK